MRIKSLPLILSAALFCLSLSGCWDYRGLDELTIVAGMAVDISEENPDYLSVTFEIVDPNGSSNQSELNSIMLTTEGPSLFQAIHNANQKLYNQMYFGNMDILVISYQLASQQGLNNIVDAFLRDFSTRDTIIALVSREKTAREIITPQKGDGIISYEISNSITSNHNSLNSVRVLNLIKIYDFLASDINNMTLPAFRFIEEPDGKKKLSADGAGIFKGDKLECFLDKKAVPYFLFTTQRLNNGTYTFFMEKGQNTDPFYATLSITKSHPKLSFRVESDTLVLGVNITAITSAIELTPAYTGFTNPDIRVLESRAQESLNREIKQIINQIQQGSGADIFGFGYEICNKDPRLWEKLKDDWESHFRDATIEVESKITINDTGLIKNYEAHGSLRASFPIPRLIPFKALISNHGTERETCNRYS
ncbi:MAG: Ger(x)C family spore germination protein [Oscillospiraceae bacterium]|jgi:spore germination protein KC|nr:Ger(x)C family spore germination protein [Oscillospiraceae bacterium]